MIKVGQIVSDITANMNPFRKDMTKVKQEGEKAAKGVESSFQQLGQRMRRTGTIMTAAVTAPVVAGFVKMSKEAALLEGAMAKFNVVFGDASDEMENWVNEFRKEVPLARTEIIKAAAAMQDLLVPMGIARDEATGMSKQWLTLASRLAAFNDVPVDQALEAIRSGIAGMSRPLRQFGIDARETVLQQVALQEGIIESGEAMDEQARQQALLIQAYDQSSDALDGFEQQQDSLLLMQQEVMASVKDLAADYGKLLIPVAKSTAKWLSDLAKTMQGFSDTTKGVITSVAGLAAAIGPAALGLGWAIKLTIPAVKSLTKVLGALRAAAIANPYTAVATAIAAIAAKSYFAEKAISQFHSEIQKVLGTATDWQTVNDKIADVENRMNELADAAKAVGVSPEQNEEFVKLRKELGRLINLRNELASQEIEGLMAGDQLQSAQELLNFINIDLSEITTVAQQADIKKPFIEAKEPMHEIIRATDMVKRGFEEMSASEILSDFQEGGLDLGKKLFPPGSLGFASQRISELKEKLQELVVGSDAFVQVKERISQMSSEMINLQTQAVTTEEMAQNFGNTLGDALEQAIIHGKELGNILSNVAKQLASKAIMTGLRFLLPGGPTIGGGSFLGALFGNVFHEGGIVGGSGDVPIVAQAGEGVFTKGQMKAMGGLIRNGGGSKMDEGTLQRAFDRALGKHLQKLGNDEIYAMAQKGRRSF